MRNAWIGIEVIVRFECAFIPRCVIHVSVIFKRKQSRCEILEEGDYGGNFRRRNERNRLLFTTRIETVLFRMIKNQYVFLSRNVLSTFRLFLNKVNTNGRNHDSKYSNRSHRALRAELLIKKKNQCIISVHFSTKQSYQRARERKKFSRNRLRTISFHLEFDL